MLKKHRGEIICAAILCIQLLIRCIMWNVAQNIDARFDIWCPLDDIIPFSEYFVIPYILWYPMYVGCMGYLIIKAKKEFFQALIYLVGGFIICDIIFIFFQNQITFRPEDTLEVDGVLTYLVSLFYKKGRTLSACPSLHCYVSGVLCVAMCRHKGYRHPRTVKISIIILTVSIFLSTAFIKQHSILDAGGALAVMAAVYPVAYMIRYPFLQKDGALMKYLN